MRLKCVWNSNKKSSQRVMQSESWQNMDRTNQDGRKRKNISIGDLVEIVQKQDQRSGDLTEGLVKRILTKSPNHPHGIKVMLDTGEVGRVKNIIAADWD